MRRFLSACGVFVVGTLLFETPKEQIVNNEKSIYHVFLVVILLFFYLSTAASVE
jgi:hypothetical protein